MSESASEDEKAKPVGALLRETRQSLGLQLQDAAMVTRIGKMYLIAMEEDKFEKLPSGAYIKGFLRLYAAYLGLSADTVIARYERTGSTQIPQCTPAPPSKNVEGIAKIRSARGGQWLIPVLLFILVIVAALLFQEDQERPSVLPQAVLKMPTPAVAPVPIPQVIVPNESIQSSMLKETLPTTDDLIAGSNEQKPEGIVLKLRFTQDSWLSITIDGNLFQHYELKSGDVIEWKAAREFTVELGRAGAVEAEFNGKALKHFGEAGVPVHLELKGHGGQDQ